MTGQETDFQRELEAGDAIIVQDPETQLFEACQVKFVLSNISLSLVEPFSRDFVSFVPFQFQKSAERAIEKAVAAKRQAMASEKKALEDASTFSYRVLKQGSHGVYELKTERLGGAVQRSDLLSKRTKVVSDKYCK